MYEAGQMTKGETVTTKTRFWKLLLALCAAQTAMDTAQPGNEHSTAVTIRNDAMLSCELAYSAQRAECRRLEKAKEADRQQWLYDNAAR